MSINRDHVSTLLYITKCIIILAVGSIHTMYASSKCGYNSPSHEFDNKINASDISGIN